MAGITGEALGLKITALQQIGRVLEDQQQDASAEEALRGCLDLDAAQKEAAQHWIALRQRQCKWPAVQPWERVSRQDLTKGISPLSLANLADDPLFQLAAADPILPPNGRAPRGPPPSGGPPWRGQDPHRLRLVGPPGNMPSASP